MHSRFRLATCGLLPLFAIAVHVERADASNPEAHPAGVAIPTFSDAVKGYAWANLASSPSYTPSSVYSYNASGGDISIHRSGAGQYTVTFSGMGSVAAGGNVQVSPYGTSASCTADSWTLASSNLEISATCRNHLDESADARFTVMFVSSSNAEDPSMAYAWAHDALGASYTPNSSHSYNGTGGAITATRHATGEYEIRFAGVGSLSGGHVQVTAYGSSARCQPVTWNFMEGEQAIRVNCFDAS